MNTKRTVSEQEKKAFHDIGDYRSLTDALLARGNSRQTMTVIEGADNERANTYAQLVRKATARLFELQSLGLRPADELVLLVDRYWDFIVTFWACILGGIVPVPVAAGNGEEQRKRLFNIWNILERPHLAISASELLRLQQYWSDPQWRDTGADMSRKLLSISAENGSDQVGKIHPANPSDTAFIQFSSGSTGRPKGVVLTHANLLTNCRAMIKGLRGSPDDRLLCWMPLTHDMGLIGFHITPLIAGWNQFLMPTETFIRQPGLWLRKLSRHRITLTASPNFGYKYVMKHFQPTDAEPLDLSSVRLIFNGAEPISAQVCRDFLDNMSVYGLKPETMFPVYGMSEACLGVTFPVVGNPLQVVRLDRRHLGIGEQVKDDALAGVEFVQVGRPVDDCQACIVGEHGEKLPENVIGHILIRGGNVTAGYYRHDPADSELHTADGWLKTGDLGFVRNEKFIVTGRAKDIIFSNGQNIYPHDIERAAESCRGIEPNKIVIGGFFDHDQQVERVVAFVQHRGKLEDFIPLALRLREHINRHCALLLTEILPVRRIPKTTSGKVQRYLLVEECRQGVWRKEEAAVRLAFSEAVGEADCVAPGNDTEVKLQRIWGKALQRRKIGVTDHFLALGGSSLIAAQVANLIMAEFSVILPLQKLFDAPTIRELAQVILAAEKTSIERIPSTPEAPAYPLSFAQKRLFILHHIAPGSVTYNLPQAVDIRGELDSERFLDVCAQLLQRHESLRTSFILQNGQSLQVIHDHVEFTPEFATIDVHDIPAAFAAFVRPFDLQRAPLFRVRLNRCDTRHHVLFFDIHHITADGASLQLLFAEWASLYNGLVLPSLPLRFRDYVIWEAGRQSFARMLEQEAFWLREYSVPPPVLDLPLDFERPFTREFSGRTEIFILPAEKAKLLKKMFAAEGATSFAGYLALLVILLGRLGRQDDVVVGAPVYCRSHADLEGVVGMFVNTLALRNYPRGDLSFRTFLQQVQRRTQEALACQEYPFEKLVEKVATGHDAGRNPLFDVMLVMEDIRNVGPALPGLEMHQMTFSTGTAKFDLTFFIAEKETGLELKIEYATHLFLPQTIKWIEESFEELLNAVLADPDRRLMNISLLPEKDRDWLHKDERQVPADYPEGETLHSLFAGQAACAPEKKALEYAGVSLTFRDLDLHTDRLAMRLHRDGVGPGSLVPILLDRSPELVIAILAVLKAGAAFVPLDPEYPDERLDYILRDCNASVAISSELYRQRLKTGCCIIDPVEVTVVPDESYSLPVVSPEAPAYVIYTSGSSGRPKGVVVEHRGVVNYIAWAIRQYVRGEQISFPLFTSISFDLTVTSLFTPLLSGNSLIIYGQEDSGVLLQRIFADDRVGVIKLTPSHLRLILEMSEIPVKLKRFIVGGENLERSLADKIHRRFSGRVEILNEYGPTETVVGCMIHCFDPERDKRSAVPIGRSADNFRIYLLDQFGQPAPMGAWGEMAIAGVGVARGYLNNPEKTAERFVPDPFVGVGRMYKTGDLSRFLPGGIMEFGGRVDQQIKIRGYRIEPAEIETCLRKHPAIREAAVAVKKERDGSNRLIAGIVPVGGMTVTAVEIRHFLAGELPGYMIPGAFAFLERLPLSANGKIDQRLLAAEVGSYDAPENVFVPPVSHREQALAAVWAEVLNRDAVGRYDNFFDFGGDSIKAVQIVSRLKEKGYALNARDVLKQQTPERMAVLMEMIDEPAAKQESSSGEKTPSTIELWFLEQELPVPGHFNQSLLLHIGRDTDLELLEKSLQIIVRYHDGLRLNCDWLKKKLFFNPRYLTEPFTFIPVSEPFPRGDALGTIARLAAEYGGFSLADELLFKALLLPGEGDGRNLLLIAHHLVVDGVSWRILLADIQRIYQALRMGQEPFLPAKTASLAEWAERLRSTLTLSALEDDLPYWQKIEQTEFELPVDSVETERIFRDVALLTGNLDQEATEWLMQGSHRIFNADISVMLLTALAGCVRDWTGRSELLIELENHGRHLDDLDVSGTVGWFTAMHPARLSLTGGGLVDHISGIKEQLAAIPNHGLGYGALKYLHDVWRPDGKKIREIRFNYLGQFPRGDDGDAISPAATFTTADIAAANPMTVKLEFNCLIVDSSFRFEIRYNRKEYRTATIERLVQGYLRHLREIVSCLQNEERPFFSPSDFDTAGIGQDDLTEMLD
jgi:amino acid adenylation domain-containing protein/non-ribosomal peptide synthase protein (TIGR01720 family)